MGFYTKTLKRSLWVFHVSASPCNNCDIEILDMLTPRYDLERLGIKLVGSVRHADVLLVTGMGGCKVSERVIRIYNQAPKPVFVIAVGTCPVAGATFKESYTRCGSLDRFVPVDLYIPGCPPKPETMIAGLSELLGRL